MMKFLSAASLALLFGAMSCSDGDGNGDGGGDGGAGGGEGNTETLTCEDFKACGGELAGTYTIESVCAEGVEAVFTTGLDAACKGMFGAFDVGVEGTASFKDGTSTLDLVQTINVTMTLDAACLQAQSGVATLEPSDSTCAMVPSAMMSSGFTSATCAFTDDACVCDAVMEQSSNDTQTYEVSGKKLVFEDKTEDPFCVSGKQLAVQIVDDSGATITYVGTSGS
jgi:hypothetical protein